MTVQPIDVQQQQRVCATTLECLQHAEGLFDLRHQPIPVSFDLRGRAAGMYRVSRHKPLIRYNPYIFSRYFEHGLQVTVPHEVAHYITDRLFGLHNVQPHGKEWRSVMRALGAEARASARLDMTGIPLRRQQRFPYRCNCVVHQLSSCRHNRIVNKKARYHCRRCGEELVVVR